MTLFPSSNNLSTKLEPMNPPPPVTTANNFYSPEILIIYKNFLIITDKIRVKLLKIVCR